MLSLRLENIRIQFQVDHSLRTAAQELPAIFAAVRLRNINGYNGWQA